MNTYNHIAKAYQKKGGLPKAWDECLVSSTAYPLNRFAKKVQTLVHMVLFIILGINSIVINTLFYYINWRMVMICTMCVVKQLYPLTSISSATDLVPQHLWTSGYCINIGVWSRLMPFILVYILWDGSANNLGHIYKMESTLFHLFITQVTTKWSLQMSPFIWLIPIWNSNLWIICHPDSI